MTDSKPATEAAGEGTASGKGATADAQPDHAEPAAMSPAAAGETLDDGEAPAILGAADAAMYMFVNAIEGLPDHKDGTFLKRADVILNGLRKLEASLSLAASRTRATPSVVVALSKARRHYNELMERAAIAPGATLGQRIYTARRSADLSVQEAANGVGLRADLLEAIEAGEPTTQDEANKIKALIAALDG
jgi:hypothetical protein